MTPLISTIIPAYNVARYLHRSVASLTAGTAQSDSQEIIIVDDGSTDATRAIAEELALHDERVWVIQKSNGGIGSARNAGLEVARGEWIHFLDADDWMLDGGLDRLLNAAEKSGLGGACGWSKLHGEDESPLDWSIGPVDATPQGEVGITELLDRSQFLNGATIIHRSKFGELRFDPTPAAAEDWDMWLRLAERGMRWKVVSTDVAAYRLRRSGVSHGFSNMASSMRRHIEASYERCRRHLTNVIPPNLLRRERLSQTIRSSTLRFATAAALDDPSPGRDGAFTILISNWAGPLSDVSAIDLAQAAFWMLPFADAKAQSAWRGTDPHTLRRYVRAASALWARLVREGVITSATAELARAELAGLCIDQDEIVARVISLCAPGRALTLVGLGRNARRLVPLLKQRALPLLARDDSLGRPAVGTGSAVSVEVDGVEVMVADPMTPYDPETLYVVTVTDDAGIVGRMPSGLDLVRWSEVREGLKSREVERLTTVWRSVQAVPADGSVQTRAAADVGDHVPNCPGSLVMPSDRPQVGAGGASVGPG